LYVKHKFIYFHSLQEAEVAVCWGGFLTLYV
jgi:hypothetical protein